METPTEKPKKKDPKICLDGGEHVWKHHHRISNALHLYVCEKCKEEWELDSSD
jgi:hypothetical protein